MSKQSSVEWLISQLQKSKDWQRVLNEVSQMSTARIDIIGQAKAMHKEEIENAYMVGNHSEMRGGKVIFEVTEKYYNETFNK